jgi:hypothetical protein
VSALLCLMLAGYVLGMSGHVLLPGYSLGRLYCTGACAAQMLQPLCASRHWWISQGPHLRPACATGAGTYVYASTNLSTTYMLNTSAATFSVASRVCQDNGGDLVYYVSAAEQVRAAGHHAARSTSTICQ